MESITIDDTIIPLTFDGFHKLNMYDKLIYLKILNTERLYKRYVYNDTSSATYINICKMIDFGHDELRVEDSDDDIACANIVATEDQFYIDFYDYKKIHMDNCECPYQYRIFHINDVFSNLITHSVCKCCKKIRTIDMMKKEELVKKRKCGLYLASNMSSENVLNVLPNDISKYVVQYI